MRGSGPDSVELSPSHRRGSACIARAAVVTAALAAGWPAFASEPPLLTGEGIYAPGEYRVPCASVLIPADALALGTRPAREVAVGETGTAFSLSTEIFGPLDHARPRRRDYVASGSCIARLRDPGPYTVTVFENIVHWVWLPHTEIRAITQRHMGSLERRSSFSIHVLPGYDPPARTDPPTRADSHPCDGTDIRAGDDSEGAEALRVVLARVFSELGARIGPEHVNVLIDGIPRFVIRFASSTGQPLHTATCQVAAFNDGTIASIDRAGHAIAGAVRQWSDNTRVTMRTFDVATNDVLEMARADADGMDDAATEAAVREAAAQLGLSFRSSLTP